MDRRTLVILITDFIDTVTAELMVENLQRLSRRHLVLFVTLKNPDLQTIVDAPPASLQAMARIGIADTMIRERQVVMERLRRLGVLCLETERQALGAELVNRYLAIKRRELI